MSVVVPIKSLTLAKSRLLGCCFPSDERNRARLVLAMAADTIAAALATPGVDRVLVAAARPDEVAELRALGADVVDDGNAADLNAALCHGAALLRRADPDGVIGALQADLPALRSDDLAAAIAEADGKRAVCADHAGTGTTLLLSASGGPLEPHFGDGSAAAHVRSGALPLATPAATLRTDVDTIDDVARVRTLGVGRNTAAVLRGARHSCTSAEPVS
ncbi:2-phospho-L-lactate guanylyltransferase [Haloechinothrix salitolerans]|uniref:Phosphoenolpyruvate guanylyltransferase n=1 Tax=Haloechinothrix salitolerans TaxID=926830 RepID=A0ABW2C3L2_9PSEU